jgi:hypothetical protein
MTTMNNPGSDRIMIRCTVSWKDILRDDALIDDERTNAIAGVFIVGQEYHNRASAITSQ